MIKIISTNLANFINQVQADGHVLLLPEEYVHVVDASGVGLGVHGAGQVARQLGLGHAHPRHPDEHFHQFARI